MYYYVRTGRSSVALWQLHHVSRTLAVSTRPGDGQLTVRPAYQKGRCVSRELPNGIFDEFEVGAFRAQEFVHTRMGCIQALARETIEAGRRLRHKLSMSAAS